MAACREIHLALIEAARKVVHLRFRPHRHQIGAAIQTHAGVVYAAVNLGANVDRASVCAEAVALGMAAADGDTDLAAVVAVDRDGQVVSPCGVCREMISDYAPGCEVVVPADPDPEVVSIEELLPRKYQRGARRRESSLRTAPANDAT